MSAVIGWDGMGWDGDDYHVFMIHDHERRGRKKKYMTDLSMTGAWWWGVGVVVHCRLMNHDGDERRKWN